MVHVGVSHEGIPDYPLKKLDNGYVVPDASVAELRRYHGRQVRNSIETSVAAEDLGYDYAVHSEHHSSLLASVQPNPILTHTAIASRTEEIRLLQMANILPWHEPVRLAEQTAMLDHISDGRAEVGVGRGFGAFAADTLGQYWGGTAQDQVRNRRSFEEKFEILKRAWTEDFVSFQGEFHRIPTSYTEHENNQEFHYLMGDVSEYAPDDFMQVDGPTTTLRSLPVLPKPLQDPHPQLWKPGLSNLSVEWAASQGMNVCTHLFEFTDVRDLVSAYHDAAEEAGWPDHRPEYDGEPFRRGWDERRRRGLATILPVFNTEIADEDTIERWKLGKELSQSRRKASAGPRKIDEFEIDVDEYLASGDTPIYGDAEEIIDRIATFREVCGYEDLFVIVHFESYGTTHEEHLDQLRAFAEDVRPYFEERSTS